MKLYELSAALRAVADRIADQEGELPPDLEAEFDSLNLALEAKLDACAAIHAELVAEARAFASEQDRLAMLSAIASNKAASLKAYMMRCMQDAGRAKVETELFRIRVQANSRPTIRMKEGMPIPSMFLRVKQEFDGDAAYRLWKEKFYQMPDSVEVIQGNHLRIS